jgi:hypothetical protein
MAETILSPGVFTNEKDLSFLPTGIAQIGAAVVGPTIKGPAFIPTIIESYNDFVATFGDTTTESYVPYTVKEYLKNAGRVTVVRTLFENGYKMDAPLGIVVSGSYGKRLVAVLHPTQKITDTDAFDYTNPTVSLFEKSLVANSTTTSGSFVLTISGSSLIPYGSTILSASLVSTSPQYINKILPLGPKTNTSPAAVSGSQPAYLYNTFNLQISASLAADANTRVEVVTGSTDSWNFSNDALSASTPYITSQQTSGNTTKNLFKFHTLSDGNAVNYEVKIGITDVRPAGTVPGSNYGAFTVVVRAVDQTNIQGSPFMTDDSDSRPNVLELFDNVTLDPNSTNYIVRRIGDQYTDIDANGKLSLVGDYPSKSKYIRVEVDSDVKNQVNSEALVPFGFRALVAPVPALFVGTVSIPAVTYVTSQVIANSYNKRKFFGFDYDLSNTDNLNFLAPLPVEASQTTGSNTDFYLGNYTQNAGAGTYTGSIDLSANTSLDTRKFMVPFQGGFDGTYPNLIKLTGYDIASTNMQGFDLSGPTETGYIAYKKAIDAVSNPDEFDINMLVLPGTNYTEHSGILDYAMNTALDRGDTFVVIDADGLPADGVPAATALADAVSSVNTIDNNYAAVYWPWVKILDTAINKPVWVPTAAVLPGVIAFNDRVSAEWYAPAGLNRGGLNSVIDAWTRLTQGERDTLYQARVNPIATFPGQGVCVWGQKTLQAKPSALDRVNVRRLLIAVKKYIASATKYLVFENNTSATRNRFLNIVNPYLSSVQQRQGLYAFKVVMDETNNTPDLIDRNIMYGQIYLQPAKTAEFIVLDFNILPTGAAFSQ